MTPVSVVVREAATLDVHSHLGFPERVEFALDLEDALRGQLPGDLSLAIIVFLGPGPPDRHNLVEFDAVFWL